VGLSRLSLVFTQSARSKVNAAVPIVTASTMVNGGIRVVFKGLLHHLDALHLQRLSVPLTQSESGNQRFFVIIEEEQD
jgi:hypothetical protein